MTKEEYIKKAEEILVSYHDNYCQTEGCKDCRKYRKLILQALYQLHLEGVREVIGEDELEEMEAPRLFQSNPTPNEMGGYSSVPFYCSLCGMGEIDIQDNETKEGNKYCNCSVWTNSCGGEWIKWLKGEKHARKIQERFYPNLRNQLRAEQREKLKK